MSVSSATVTEATDSLLFFRVGLLRTKGKSIRSCLAISTQDEFYNVFNKRCRRKPCFDVVASNQ